MRLDRRLIAEALEPRLHGGSRPGAPKRSSRLVRRASQTSTTQSRREENETKVLEARLVQFNCGIRPERVRTESPTDMKSRSRIGDPECLTPRCRGFSSRSFAYLGSARKDSASDSPSRGGAVHVHGGAVRAVNRAGGGLTVVISIPLDCPRDPPRGAMPDRST